MRMVSAGPPRPSATFSRCFPTGGNSPRHSCATRSPLLEGSIEYGVGKRWGGRFSVGPRVLTTLSAAGQIVRATNVGGWTSSRPRWATMKAWLGEDIVAPPEEAGVAKLVELWLRAFGPGTATDIKWWLASTVAAVKQALVDVHAVEVDIGGKTGYLRADDLEPTDPVAPWGALLPPLDPTTMGWFERDWYLGPYKAQVFDTAGNAGSTACGTGASWAAGANATTARSSCSCSRRSAPTDVPPWEMRRPDSVSGSPARESCRDSPHLCGRPRQVLADDRAALAVSVAVSAGPALAFVHRLHTGDRDRPALLDQLRL